MNKVTLTVVITRWNARHTAITYFRDGAGDDLVEARADQLEAAIQSSAVKLVQDCGGSISRGNDSSTKSTEDGQ